MELKKTIVKIWRKSVGEIYEKIIDLIGHILIGQRSQIFPTQNTVSPSKGKKETARGQIRMERQVRSKNQAIQAKSITEQEGKKERLNETIFEEQALINEIFIKCWASVHEEGPAKGTNLLKSYPTNSCLTEHLSSEDEDTAEINAAINELTKVSEQLKDELLFEDFIQMVKKVRYDSTCTDEKCLEFLKDLYDVLHNNVGINYEKWLKIEIVEFKLISVKLEYRGKELYKFLELVFDFTSVNRGRKASLKNELRRNIDSVYTVNSTLVGYFVTIIDELRVMDDEIVIKGSKENTIRTMIAKFLHVIERMNSQIICIQNMLQCLDEIFY